MIGLTPTQAKVLAAIRAHFAVHPYGPTFREIMGITGQRSTKLVHDNVGALEERGYITRRRGYPRSIRLVGYPYPAPGIVRRDASGNVVEIAPLRWVA